MNSFYSEKGNVECTFFVSQDFAKIKIHDEQYNHPDVIASLRGNPGYKVVPLKVFNKDLIWIAAFTLAMTSVRSIFSYWPLGGAYGL